MDIIEFLNVRNMSRFYQSNWSEMPPLDLDHCQTPQAVRSFVIATYCVLIALGLLGNSLLVLVILRHSELHNVTNILIVNLAFSDMLVGLVCLPLTIAYTLMDHWIFGEALCKGSPFLQCSAVSVSIFSLVLIAIERHQLIINPTGWKPSLNHAYVAIGAIWVTAFAMSSPFLAFHVLTDEPYRNLSHYFPDYGEKVACIELWPSDTSKFAFTTSLLVFQFSCPLLFVFLCYLRIFLRLRQRKKMLPTGREGGGNGVRASHMKKINMMLVAIVAGFAICWLPLYAFNAVSDWNPTLLLHCQHDLIFSLCHLTAMLSICINPIFYGFLNNNFQKELKATILCCQCNPVEEDLENFPLSTMNTDISKGSLRFSCKNSSA
ncbi:neuropeptide Y receptor type 1-like [Petromyzon marinus]|uniref:Neuropeptide Y receptor type 1-like n=2 Tax=Petromyzon marinus TaxID=7757 RepID=A0AAJ7WPR9_PETMA|nr:neuropeptide Y receptor type 1-like [Petromyzon marinus]